MFQDTTWWINFKKSGFCWNFIDGSFVWYWTDRDFGDE